MSDIEPGSGGDWLSRVNAIGKERDESEREAIEATKSEGGLLGRILGTVLKLFSVQWNDTWTRAASVFSYILGPIGRFFTGDLWAISKSDLTDMMDVFITNGMLDKDDINALSGFMDRATVAGRFVAPLLKVFMWFKIFSSFTDVLGGTAIQNLNRKYSPTVPSPESVVRTSFIAPELHDKVVNLCKRAGFSEDDIKLLFVSQYALQNPVDIMQLVWRGVLDKDQAINRMQEIGFTADRTAELMQLWERIPSLQDIVRYMGKEAFEPGMINTFGLMEDFPGESVDWAAKNGLGKRWAEAEWVSHWRDIGINFMLDAFHRDIVDWPFVERYMRLIEFPPGVREVVKETAVIWANRLRMRSL